jgi:hypothetical protein
MAICCERRGLFEPIFFNLKKTDWEGRARAIPGLPEHYVEYDDPNRPRNMPGFEIYDEAYELACFAWESQMFDEIVEFPNIVNNVHPIRTITDFDVVIGKLKEAQEKSWRNR